MRGFISGVIWGSIVAVLGLGAVSQLVPLPQVRQTSPDTPSPDAVALPEVAVPDPASSPAAPETGPESAPEKESADEGQTGSLASSPAMPVTATLETAPAPLAEPAASASQPPAAPAPDALAAAPAALVAPQGPAPAPLIHVPTDAPVIPADPTRPAPPGDDARPATAELPPPPPLTPKEEALLQPAPQGVTEPETAPAEPEPLDQPRPAPGFADAVEGVTSDRLPRIGDAPASNPAADTLAEPGDDLPAMVRYARAFENPSKKPVFAVILIDTGGPDLDRTTLAALPFPVTFAIDPTAPDAATAAAIYRAAGQEVLMLATGIPQGATASDLEVTFQAHAAALPEAVAVLDVEDGGFQNDRPLATQVVPVIKGQGRALITWDKGMNAGDQVARREGLASALIFRRLDAAGESVPTMRRYLDRAAFKAAQDGRVAVVGETRPETVAALLEWTVEGRASSVALAPVTAALTTP